MPLALPPGPQPYIEGEYKEISEGKLQKLKKAYAELKRKRAEQVEQKRVADIANNYKKLEQSKKSEELALQKTIRESRLAEQKVKEKAAVLQARVASQQRAQAVTNLRHEKLQTVKESVSRFVKPMFTPVKFGVRAVAQSGSTHFYSLGNKPQTLSPSYQALESAFNGEPFSAQQAIQVVSGALQTSEQDAQRRLVLMKNYGFIKLEV